MKYPVFIVDPDISTMEETINGFVETKWIPKSIMAINLGSHPIEGTRKRTRLANMIDSADPGDRSL